MLPKKPIPTILYYWMEFLVKENDSRAMVGGQRLQPCQYAMADGRASSEQQLLLYCMYMKKKKRRRRRRKKKRSSDVGVPRQLGGKATGRDK